MIAGEGRGPKVVAVDERPGDDMIDVNWSHYKILATVKALFSVQLLMKFNSLNT